VKIRTRNHFHLLMIDLQIPMSLTASSFAKNPPAKNRIFPIRRARNEKQEARRDMSMQKKRWKAPEIDELLRRYPTEGAAPLAFDLDRSINSVASQACHLGLPSLTRRIRQTQTRKWKQMYKQELAFLCRRSAYSSL
jgi:hypothetical protein